MASTEVSAGTIHYEEIGDGPPLVMVGGLAMDGRLWERVAAELAPTHRCLMPTLPFGAHPSRCAPTPISRCAGWAGSSPSSSRASGSRT